MYGPGVSSTMRGLSRWCGASAASVSRMAAEEQRQPLDVALAKRVGQDPRDDDAVLERVARPRGRLRPIGQHVKLAGGEPYQIGGVEKQIPVRRHRQAVTGTQEPRVSEHQLGRQPAFGQRALRSVEVGQDAVQQQRPLGQPRRQDAANSSGAQQHRNGIEGPGALHALRGSP